MYEAHIRYIPFNDEMIKLFDWIRIHTPTCSYQFLKLHYNMNYDSFSIEIDIEIIELSYQDFISKILFKSDVFIRFHFTSKEDHVLFVLTWGNDKVV